MDKVPILPERKLTNTNTSATLQFKEMGVISQGTILSVGIDQINETDHDV